MNRDSMPNCQKCACEYVYEDRGIFICPECSFEWSKHQKANEDDLVKDANGTILVDGDTVTIIKDLKIKGSSSSLKVGTKVKNIRVISGDGDHNIDCKIPGIGGMKLKSEFVRKA